MTGVLPGGMPGGRGWGWDSRMSGDTFIRERGVEVTEIPAPGGQTCPGPGWLMFGVLI